MSYRKIFNNKRLIFILIVILFGICEWLLYASFGHKFIEAMYNGEPCQFLNRIIERLRRYPLEHCFNVADRILFTLNVYFVGILGLFYFFFKMDLKNIYRTNQRKIILLVFILMLAVGMRIAYFSGYSGSDDGKYAELAYKMATGDFKIGERNGVLAPVFPLRVGLIAPVAFGFMVTGLNEFTMIGYPFLISILGIILAFIAGRLFFDSIRAGLIAATLTAILPIDIRSASMLFSDLPAAFWMNLGVFLIYYGSKQEKPRSKSIYGALSGLSFALSWLCRESIAYLFPFIVLYMAWLVYRQKQNVFLVTGVSSIGAAVLIAESFIYYKYTLDFFYRLHEAEKNYEVCKIWFFDKGTKWGYGAEGYLSGLLKRIFLDGPKTIFMNQNFGFVTGTALLAVCWAIFKKARKFLIPGFWFISLVFMFNFGSSSLKSYKPLVLFDNRMYPLLFPAILLTGGFIDTLITEQKKGGKKSFLANLLIVCIIFACGYVQTGIGSPVERIMSRGYLKPGDIIYTDSRTAWVLKFFWKYPKETRTFDFTGMAVNEIPEEAYVLINRDRADFINEADGYVLPEFYCDLPDYWELKWRKNRAELYWVPMAAKRKAYK